MDTLSLEGVGNGISSISNSQYRRTMLYPLLSAEYIKKIKTPTIKALNGNDINLDSKIKQFSKPEFILLDNINKDSKGGSGEKFDWKNILNLDNKDYLFISGKNSGSLLTEIKNNNIKTNNLEKVFEKRLMNEKN